MNEELIRQKNAILKNKLNIIKNEITKLSEIHRDLKPILKENIVINDQIAAEDLYSIIEKDINNIKTELIMIIENIIVD